MWCEFVEISDNRESKVIINDNEAYVENEIVKQSLNVGTRECFNTLISLLSLKSSWIKKECLNPIYRITFNSSDKIETYIFDHNNLPDNWLLFIGYISRLVGESL